MTTEISPTPIFQSFLPSGQFNAGGKVFTYAAGTTTPQATFTDSTGTTPNTNPIILNSLGQAQVWLTANLIYKYVVQDQFGNPLYTTDQINGALSANNVVIGPPASGVALTISNASGSDVIDANINQAPGAGFLINAQGSTNTDLRGIFFKNTLAGGAGNSIALFIANDTSHVFEFGKQMSGNTGAQFTNGIAGDASWIQSAGASIPIMFVINTTNQMTLGVDGLNRPLNTMFANLTVNGNMTSTGTLINAGLSSSGPIGINGATPPLQNIGWGVPTGGAAVANFPGAGPATLAQCSTAIAEIIFALKNLGLFGA